MLGSTSGLGSNTFNVVEIKNLSRVRMSTKWEDGTAATAPDCKSGISHGGSSPSLPTRCPILLMEESCLKLRIDKIIYNKKQFELCVKIILEKLINTLKKSKQ